MFSESVCNGCRYCLQKGGNVAGFFVCNEASVREKSLSQRTVYPNEIERPRWCPLVASPRKAQLSVEGA